MKIPFLFLSVVSQNNPFFTIHKQFLAHLYDSINKKSVIDNRKDRISQISHCFTPEGTEDLY